VRLGEIAREVGLNEATCAHLLATLVEADYVEQPVARQGYVLGPMVPNLGRNHPYRERLVRVAQPVLEALTAATGETALVAVLHRGRRFILTYSEGNREIQVSRDLYFREDLYGVATGRLLLAHLAEAELRALLSAQGLPGSAWPEAATETKLARELVRLREEDGVVVPYNQTISFALPLYQGGSVVAALGAYLPTARFTGAHKRLILAEMRKAARAISEQLSSGSTQGKEPNRDVRDQVD
jgi:DNA-binding IclR family transcriptional regulator